VLLGLPVLTAVLVKILVLWDVTPWSYRRFGASFYHILRPKQSYKIRLQPAGPLKVVLLRPATSFVNCVYTEKVNTI
jgi:hypothetical protein